MSTSGSSMRKRGRVPIADVATLSALYHGSLARRVLFLKTEAPPPFGTALDLVLEVAQPTAQISLPATVRFVADAHSPKGAGCGVELGDSAEGILARLQQGVGPLPARDAAKSPVSVSVLFDGSPAPTPAGDQRRALVVDDDLELQKVYVRLLESAGFHVLVAKDGLAALELFKGQDIALVVLDYLLPRLDGMKVAEEMLKARKVPIVFCSAVTRDQQMAGKIRALGVGWVLEKPFRLEHLRKAFDEAIRAALQIA